MKKIYLFLFIAFSAFSLNAQVIFSEDFDGIPGSTAGGAGTYTFPNGWFLRNVDARTPDPAVAYVNDAWERREDFNFNVTDSAAFSTSWYSPVGAADDWMWTPLVGPLPANCILKWNAVTYDALYPDGYSVRIMTSSQGPPTGGTGLLGNQVTNSTQVFSVAAENTTWTARQLSLSAYAGQSIYIGFRNTSNDKFLLLIDDISVEVQLSTDVQMSYVDTASPYTIMPANQTSPLTFNGTLRNNGINTLSNVYAHVNVFRGSTNVYSANSTTTASLASSATVNWSVPSFTPSGAGNYTIQYIANQGSGTDQQPANDTVYKYLVVDDSTYARDDGTVIGSLGIGAGNGGYIGQSFQVTNGSAPLTSVGVYYTTGDAGLPAGLAIWSTNANGMPVSIIGVTDTITYPDDSARYYDIPVNGGPLSLAPGNYVVTAIEFDSTLALGTTQTVYTMNAGWVWWPTIPGGTWMNPEDFGPNFAVAFVVRPIFADVCLDNSVSFNVTQASCLTCNDGGATVIPAGANGTISYSWSSGGNTATESGLGTGTYTVTVTDGFNCAVTGTVVVPFDTCGGFSATTSVVNTSCASCADGSAIITVTGGYGTLTYTWANSTETSDTLSNVLYGTYTVTVTDSFGCAITEQIIVNQNICGNVLITTDSTQASCSTCADGSAWVTVSGNNGPVTILWSNSATTDTISGLLPGTYTATVTDSAGCTFVVSVTVPSDICGDITASVSSQQASCSACADGSAVYTVTGANGPLTYLWSDNQTGATAVNLLPGTYYVTATDSAGCSVTDTIVVAYDICGDVSFTTIVNDASCGSCSDGSATVVVTGNNGPVTYLWNNSTTGSTASNLAPGVYTVVFTDSAGCTFYDTITVFISGGVEENTFPGEVSLYPNPNGGEFTLSLDMHGMAEVRIELFNVLGEKVSDRVQPVSGNTNVHFDLELASGRYMMRLSTSEGSRTLPVIIQ